MPMMTNGPESSTEPASNGAADDPENGDSSDNSNASTSSENVPYADQIEPYAGGHITSKHGRVHWWLAVVYLILFLWALYYGFIYWGGLGPGLDY